MADWAAEAEKKIGELIKGANSKFVDLMDAANKNADYIKQNATTGKKDVVDKLKKAHAQLQEKIKSTREYTMKTLDDDYKKMAADKEVDKKKLEDFQAKINKALDDSGDKTSKQYAEAKEKVKGYAGKTKEDFDKYYKDIQGKLNTAYDDIIKKTQV